MYRFALRPKWLAFHLLVVVAVVAMVNLGIWQLHRLQDRREFNDDVRSRGAMPVAPFDDVVTGQIDDVDDGDLVEWRLVRVEGRYLADEQVVVINRAQGGVTGQNVVTPLQTADGDLVLVNRGFVATGTAVPAPPSGPVTVTGRVRATQRRSFGGLTESSDGELTELQRLDIERLAPQLPGPVAPVYVDLLEAQPSTGGDPEPVPAPELSEGSHLSYMIQWFIFAACAVAGWVLALRRSASRQISAAQQRTRVDPPSASGGEPATAGHGTPPPPPS